MSDPALGFPGVMIEQIGQKTMTVSACSSSPWNWTNFFLFAFETKGWNFESTVIFFYNSNVKLKYMFKYLC